MAANKDADTAQTTTEETFGPLIWTSLLKIEGRGKTGSGQGNYRPADGAPQGGLYLPVVPMEAHGTPRLVRVLVTEATEREKTEFFEQLQASIMGTGPVGNGNGHAQEGSGGRA